MTTLLTNNVCCFLLHKGDESLFQCIFDVLWYIEGQINLKILYSWNLTTVQSNTNTSGTSNTSVFREITYFRLRVSWSFCMGWVQQHRIHCAVSHKKCLASLWENAWSCHYENRSLNHVGSWLLCLVGWLLGFVFFLRGSTVIGFSFSSFVLLDAFFNVFLKRKLSEKMWF